MHKTVIALAIAGLAAAPAFADSSVTIYGSIDYGWLYRGGDSGLREPGKVTCVKGTSCLSKTEFASGVSVPNRLGFKGSEDLGNGTKVIFELEMGYLADTGDNSIGGAGGTVPESGPLFRRHSWVGLTGDWGTVLGGRVDGARYSVAGKYDPFEQGGVGNQASLQVHATRADNAIAYVTPNMEGLYAVIAYTTSLIGQEAGGNNGDTRDFVLQPNFVQGPLSVTLNYERLRVHNSPINAATNVYVGGASYDFGVIKVLGYWERVKTDTDNGTPLSGALANQTSWLLGGVVPITEKDKVRFSYVSYIDHTPARDSCKKWGIGGVHFISKRTNFYADFASLNQIDHGHCTIYPTPTAASADAGNGSNQTGVGTRGFDAGIVHRF